MLRWTVHLKGLPETPYDAAVAVDHKVYCFRGDFIGSEDRTEVHVFNTVSLCWTKLPETPGREQRPFYIKDTKPTAVLINPFIYIWGRGISTWNNSTVLYAFDVDNHRMLTPRVSGTVPERRRYHSACVLGKVMFIYGGSNQTGLTNDMYKLDTSTMVWSEMNTRGTPPPASWFHSSTIIGTKMFVFGGLGTRYYYYNTLRVFDTETNHWVNTPSAQLLPEGSQGHSAFTYNGELFKFAGSNGGQKFNDLWKYNPETFSWKEVKPKGNGPLAMTFGFCGMVGDRTVVFGGLCDDLFVLDLSPSLKTLCKLGVIQYGLDQSELPHDIRWELAAMTIPTANRKRFSIDNEQRN